MQNTLGKLFTICEWIMKLAYVNLLWFFYGGRANRFWLHAGNRIPLHHRPQVADETGRSACLGYFPINL